MVCDEFKQHFLEHGMKIVSVEYDTEEYFRNPRPVIYRNRNNLIHEMNDDYIVNLMTMINFGGELVPIEPHIFTFHVTNEGWVHKIFADHLSEQKLMNLYFEVKCSCLQFDFEDNLIIRVST